MKPPSKPTRPDANAAHRKIARPRMSDYLAVMSRAILQAGASWAQIDRQWDKLEAAFEGFDPARVGRYGGRDLERLERLVAVRHRTRKIGAIVQNAKVLLELQEQPGGVAAYLRSFSDYAALSGDVKRRFAFVGDISAYYFLFRVGADVPPFKRWIKTVEGEHPRVREMVGG